MIHDPFPAREKINRGAPKGNSNRSKGVIQRHGFLVYVTKAEHTELKQLACESDMSMNAYCRKKLDVEGAAE